MAFPVEQSTNTTTQTSRATSWGAQNMPLGIVAGDTLCAFVAVDGANRTVTFTGGWTKLLDGATGSDGSVTLAVAYKKAVGSDTLSLTISSSEEGACRVVRIDSAEDPDTQAPEIGTVTTGVSATPTIDAISPTGGSKDYKFYSLCAHDRNRIFTSAPTNYQTNERTLVSGGSGGAQISDGDRDLNASVENPDNFTYAASDGFATVVLAIHPVFAGIARSPGVGNLTATGQAPVLNIGVQLPLGTLSLTGFVPTAESGITIAVPVGSLTLTGFAPTVEISHVAIPDTGTLVLTGLAATVEITHIRDPTLGSLTLTGFSPILQITQLAQIPVGSLSLSGFAPTLLQTFSIDVPVGSVTFTGFAPIAIPPSNFDIPVGSLSLTGQIPTVSIFVEPLPTEEVFPRFQKVTLVKDFFSATNNLLTEAGGKLLKEDGGGLLSQDDTIIPVYATTIIQDEASGSVIMTRDLFISVRMPR